MPGFAFGELKNGGIRICKCGEVTLEDDTHWCDLVPTQSWLEEENGIIMLCWGERKNKYWVVKYRTALGIRRPQIPAGENEQSWGLHATPNRGRSL